MARDEAGDSRPVEDDWPAVVERALSGDAAAYAALVRLVTGHLARWRAYDFQADWEDVAQEVLVSAFEAYRDERIPSMGHFRAFVRQAARFKFVDRLRTRSRRPESGLGDTDPAFEADGGDAHWPPRQPIRATAADHKAALEIALSRLPEQKRAIALEVYALGRSYREASEKLGIPEGTLKRELRETIKGLRAQLEPARS